MSSGRSHRLFAKLMTPKDWVATFIAIVALATSVWSGIATRTYNRLATRPNLRIAELFAPSSPRLGTELYNLGPGTAIIDDFHLSFDGKRLTGDWVDQCKQFRKTTGIESWVNCGGFHAGDVLAPNPSVLADILFIVDESQFSRQKPEQWKEQSRRLAEALSRLTVDIKYHSVYGEYFELESELFKPPRHRRRNWLNRYVEWQP